MKRKLNEFPPNLVRAVHAAVVLGCGPERICEAAGRAALWEYRQDYSHSNQLPPEAWLSLLRCHLPPKPRLQLVPRLTAAGAPFPRVWSPHLSVLDCDLPNGERFIWHVPSKPANDTRADG